MATIPSSKFIAHSLLAMNWMGHVEIPVNDVYWIADSIHAILTKKSPSICEGCGQARLVVVSTRAGDFCDDCVEELWDALEERRET